MLSSSGFVRIRPDSFGLVRVPPEARFLATSSVEVSAVPPIWLPTCDLNCEPRSLGLVVSVVLLPAVIRRNEAENERGRSPPLRPSRFAGAKIEPLAG